MPVNRSYSWPWNSQRLAQLDADRAALREVEKTAREPLRLPSDEEVLREVFNITAAMKEDPVAAREQLRRMFRDGRIVLELGPDGVYVGRSELLPLILFKTKNADPLIEDPRVSTSVAGAISMITRAYSSRCFAFLNHRRRATLLITS